MSSRSGSEDSSSEEEFDDTYICDDMDEDVCSNSEDYNHTVLNLKDSMYYLVAILMMHQTSAEEGGVEVELEDRIGKKDWCNGGECHVEEREVDCLCCQEELAISEEKFNGKSTFT